MTFSSAGTRIQGRMLFGTSDASSLIIGGAKVMSKPATVRVRAQASQFGPGGGLNIHVYGNGPVGQAVLNVATGGTELNYDNVRLFVSDGGSNSDTFFGCSSSTGEEIAPAPQLASKAQKVTA